MTAHPTAHSADGTGSAAAKRASASALAPTAPRIGLSRAVALVGLEGHIVDVEAAVTATIPGFVVVGLPDAALGEARDRVRSAVQHTGISWPNRKVVVNLSPASLPKSGAGFDLAIAMAVLAGAGTIEAEQVAAEVYLGELGLDGTVRPIAGVLPAVAAAAGFGYRRVIVPCGNADEAALVPGINVVAVDSLAEAAMRHGAMAVVRPAGVRGTPRRAGPSVSPEQDLCDVIGQPLPRRALEVAAAGGHHLLMVGPPGAGKTMLAERLPSILPDLDDSAAVEVTSIHSIAGQFDPAHGLLRRPPFVDPHHTATVAAIVGGGPGMPRPGAVSRAHRGTLFLDEAPEFAPRVLQTLRQPLESGVVSIQRAQGTATYPARFQLVLAANPCPCGKSIGLTLDCECPPIVRRRYFGRLSGPLLDRIDIQVEVLPTRRSQQPLQAMDEKGESSSAVAARVAMARSIQTDRLAGTPWRLNGEVSGAFLRQQLRLPPPSTRDLDRALGRGAISMRGYDRTLRLAWTLADLAGHTAPNANDIGEAMVLRHRGGLP